MTVKRAFDVLAATLGLLVLSPVLIVVAALIKLTSRGPVLHRAHRVGLDGSEIVVLKFRTMRVSDDEGAGITTSSDPRITPIGRVLRRLKVDELPQLLNVVGGDMSLVGPRPEDPRYVAGYTDEQRRVLTVRPGMTSPASLAYRDEEHVIAEHGGDVATVYRDLILPAKLAIDLEYVRDRTFWLDVSVLVRTGVAIVRSARR